VRAWGSRRRASPGGRVGDPGAGGRGEGFAGELEQDPVIRGSCAAVIHACRDPPSGAAAADDVGGRRVGPSLPRRYSASSPSLNRANRLTCTFSPVFALTSSRYCWIVLLSCFTNGWVQNTLCFRKRSV